MVLHFASGYQMHQKYKKPVKSTVAPPQYDPKKRLNYSHDQNLRYKLGCKLLDDEKEFEDSLPLFEASAELKNVYRERFSFNVTYIMAIIIERDVKTTKILYVISQRRQAVRSRLVVSIFTELKLLIVLKMNQSL